jgi:MFS family permease
VAFVAAVAPTLPLEIVALVPLGAASVTFAAGINSSLQLTAEPAMRGRVMALYSVVFLGSTPIGGPIAGWLGESIDPRAALVLAGVAGLTAAIGARVAFARVPAPAPARNFERPAPPRLRRLPQQAVGAEDGRRACDPALARASESV